MARIIHRAKTLPAIPLDYIERFDASTSFGMKFNTDEATGDITEWSGQCGLFEPLATDGTGTYVTWNKAQKRVETLATGRHLQSSTTADCTAYNATNTTQFLVGAFASLDPAATRVGFSGPNEFNFQGSAASSGNPFTSDGTFGATPTNDQGTRVCVFAQTMTHNGVDDNDGVAYLGDSNIGSTAGATDSVVGGITRVCIGGSTGSFYFSNFYFHEWIIYDRVLSSAEITKVVDYLSNKWSAQNQDAASLTISTASTAATWQGNYLDHDGAGETNIPGKQTGEYSIVRVGDRDAPRVSGSNLLNKNFPLDTWGSNVLFWFDANVTSGMTFATGDAKSGGTVSSWDDITGNVTMNTATSGDAAVDFLPHHKGSAAIQGGSSASPKSLEATTGTSTGTNNGDQSLFWAVVDWDENAAQKHTAAPCGLKSNFLFPCTGNSSAAGDLPNHDFAPVTSYAAGSSGWEAFGYASIRPPYEGKHIFVWRLTINGTDADVESWYHGMKLPDRLSSSADGTNTRAAVGALSPSNYDAEGGRCFEMGGVDVGAGTITDAQVDDLIRFLCEKYDEAYMLDTTPLDIGLQTRSTAFVAQTDACLWWDAGEMTGSGTTTNLPLHPKCAKFHTTPTDFTMIEFTPANSEEPTISAYAGRKGVEIAVGDGLESRTAYDMAETTDFPAVSEGASYFIVGNLDDATGASTYICNLGTVGGIRRFSTFTQYQTFAGNVALSSGAGTLPATRTPTLMGASYWFDDDGTGTPDADPYSRIHLDSAYEQDTNNGSGAYSSFATIQPSIASSALTGVGVVAEMVVFKHPLSAREWENLYKYAQYKYPGSSFSLA